MMLIKGGGYGGGVAGCCGGIGPTAAAAVAALQKQKALLQRVETDITSVIYNFTQIVNVSRVSVPPVKDSQEAHVMETRASRLVQAADSLLKLVLELKQTAMFSGFASSLNDHVEQRIKEFDQEAEKTNRLLAIIADTASASLKELESHYYSSAQRLTLDI